MVWNSCGYSGYNSLVEWGLSMPSVHILGNLLLIAVFGFLGWALARRKRSAIVGIGLSGLAALLSVVIAVRPDLVVAVVPYHDLTFYDNLYPLAIVLFVPCVWHFVNTRALRVRMVFWCGLLFVMSLHPYSYHIAPLAESGGTFIDDDGVCRQTSDYTCSAASVVTLLRTYDVQASEAEAVELARTKEGKGTESLGLYRALRHYADRVDGHVTTVRRISMDELLNRTEPAIILVGLPSLGRSRAAAAFGRENNWPIGIYHDVVYMGPDPEHTGRVLIADPDVGLESWPTDHLRYLFRGQAVMYDKK